VERLDDAVRVVLRAVGGEHRVGEGVAAIGGAEHGAAQAHDAAYVARRQRPGAARLDEAVKAVLDTDAFDTSVAGRFDDRSDHGVQSRRVAAASQDGETSDRCHAVDYSRADARPALAATKRAC